MPSLKGKEYKRFEDIKQIRDDGNEYWSARELAPVLEYANPLRCRARGSKGNRKELKPAN